MQSKKNITSHKDTSVLMVAIVNYKQGNRRSRSRSPSYPVKQGFISLQTSNLGFGDYLPIFPTPSPLSPCLLIYLFVPLSVLPHGALPEQDQHQAVSPVPGWCLATGGLC